MSISEVDSYARRDQKTGEYSVKTFPIWVYNQTGVTSDGRIVGGFQKVGKLSDLTVARHRINFLPDFTWEDCVRLEGFPDGVASKIPTKM